MLRTVPWFSVCRAFYAGCKYTALYTEAVRREDIKIHEIADVFYFCSGERYNCMVCFEAFMHIFSMKCHSNDVHLFFAEKALTLLFIHGKMINNTNTIL